MTSEECRLERLDKIAQYLGDVFPDHEIEKHVEDENVGCIRVIRNSEVIHEVRFGRAFLEDHPDLVASLKGWGFLRRLKGLGSEPVWIGTKGLS